MSNSKKDMEMNNENVIFNKETVDTETLKKLGIKSTTSTLNLTIHEKRVLELFKDKDTELTVVDIVLGYYNKYTKDHSKEKLINRNYMGLIVYRMAQKKLLKAVKRGVYKLI